MQRLTIGSTDNPGLGVLGVAEAVVDELGEREIWPEGRMKPKSQSLAISSVIYTYTHTHIEHTLKLPARAHTHTHTHTHLHTFTHAYCHLQGPVPEGAEAPSDGMCTPSSAT